jgi:hypothetical protein
MTCEVFNMADRNLTLSGYRASFIDQATDDTFKSIPRRGHEASSKWTSLVDGMQLTQYHPSIIDWLSSAAQPHPPTGDEVLLDDLPYTSLHLGRILPRCRDY